MQGSPHTTLFGTAREGEVVAIFGVGGLGHLGIQFASKMGFKTIAIGRGKDKEEIVRKHYYYEIQQ